MYRGIQLKPAGIIVAGDVKETRQLHIVRIGVCRKKMILLFLILARQDVITIFH